jgi:hypothetical protein
MLACILARVYHVLPLRWIFRKVVLPVVVVRISLGWGFFEVAEDRNDTTGFTRVIVLGYKIGGKLKRREVLDVRSKIILNFN